MGFINQLPGVSPSWRCSFSAEITLGEWVKPCVSPWWRNSQLGYKPQKTMGITHRIRMYGILMVCHLPSILTPVMLAYIPYDWILWYYGYISTYLSMWETQPQTLEVYFWANEEKRLSTSKMGILSSAYYWEAGKIKHVLDWTVQENPHVSQFSDGIFRTSLEMVLS